ncbi:MAG: hypothetical protein AB7P04_00125 [Bacteriovoracia bacterium]
MKKPYFNVKTLFAIAAAVTAASSAQASTSIGIGGGITAGGGSALVSSTAPTLGGELTFGVGNLSFGGRYMHDILSVSGGSGSRDFAAGLVRLTIPFSFGIFIDGMAGISSVKTTVGTAESSSSGFAVGFGAGSSIDLGPTFALMPRVGYRSNPSIFDVTLLFAFVVP